MSDTHENSDGSPYRDRLLDVWRYHCQMNPDGADPTVALEIGMRVARGVGPEPLPDRLSLATLRRTCEACRLHYEGVAEHDDGDPWVRSTGLYDARICREHRAEIARNRSRADDRVELEIKTLLNDVLILCDRDPSPLYPLWIDIDVEPETSEGPPVSDRPTALDPTETP